MKKIVLSAASAAAIALVLTAALVRPAMASEPKSKFNSMKKALMLASSKGKRQGDVQTHIEVGSKVGPNGSVGTFVVVDGQLTELQPGVPPSHRQRERSIHFCSPGFQLVDARTKGAYDEMIQQMMSEAMSGNGASERTMTYMNGQPVDPATMQQILRDHGIELKLSIDLDENHYKSISFG